jgi:non-heme chloroperoxidase
MSILTTTDGTTIYYKDWGAGRPIVFSHGWPLSSDAWEDTMLFLAARGYRCIAADRRGHGRSSQPWSGNDMDTYADDLAELTRALALERAIHIGHSTGGGEAARYLGRHGTSRVAGLVLVSDITPVMVRSEGNPRGTPVAAFDRIRDGIVLDRAQYFKDLAEPFYGANRVGSNVSPGLKNFFWTQALMAGFPACYMCVKVFSETDLTEDLKKIDVPTLIVHGDDDQIVPIAASALRSSKIVKNAHLKIYPGAPHGLPSTHMERLNADLLEFFSAIP